MNLKKKILAVFVCSASVLAFSQNGGQVYPFLNLPFSARQAALGGDAISIRDHDVNFVATNPSLNNLDTDERISLNYANYLSDSKYGTISYARDLGNGHLISAHARYMDYGTMIRTDEYAQNLGEFSATDATVGIGYAYQFHEDWTIGGGLNYVSSKIDHYNSMAITGTGAITYHLEKRKETLSLVARNFGYQFKTYNGIREPLPFRIDLGYSRILDEFPVAITITIHDIQRLNISESHNNNGQKINFLRKAFDHLSFGAELFPKENFNIRIGYNVKRGNELAVVDQRSFAGLSAGFGFKVSYFKFDYAHVRYHNSSNVNMIGLNMDIMALSGKRR